MSQRGNPGDLETLLLFTWHDMTQTRVRNNKLVYVYVNIRRILLGTATEHPDLRDVSASPPHLPSLLRPGQTVQPSDCAHPLHCSRSPSLRVARVQR